jgi:hypothetical protein
MTGARRCWVVCGWQAGLGFKSKRGSFLVRKKRGFLMASSCRDESETVMEAQPTPRAGGGTME